MTLQPDIVESSTLMPLYDESPVAPISTFAEPAVNVEPPCTFRTQFVALNPDPLTYRATPTKKRLMPESVTVAPFRTVIDVPGPPEPLYVTRIEDANGNVIAQFTPKTHEIIDETTAYKMIYMLREVIDHGTGIRARYKYGLKAPMGGKTGTTNNNSDGWFMCFTPRLVNGAWVGGEDRAIHFDNMAEGQGASMALPICAIYMQKIFKDQSLGYSEEEEFNVPEWFDPNEGCE